MGKILCSQKSLASSNQMAQELHRIKPQYHIMIFFQPPTQNELMVGEPSWFENAIFINSFINSKINFLCSGITLRALEELSESYRLSVAAKLPAGPPRWQNGSPSAPKWWLFSNFSIFCDHAKIFGQVKLGPQNFARPLLLRIWSLKVLSNGFGIIRSCSRSRFSIADRFSGPSVYIYALSSKISICPRRL